MNISLRDAEESRETRSNGKTTTTIIKLNTEGKKAISVNEYRKESRKRIQQTTKEIKEEAKKYRDEYERMNKLDEYRWNHPNKFLRLWWRFYLSIEV